MSKSRNSLYISHHCENVDSCLISFLFSNVGNGVGLQDRKRTLEQIKTFLDTKVAPKEFVEEIKVPSHWS